MENQTKKKTETKRDAQRYELASVALQGLLRHSSIEGLNTADLAETAVDLADEMMKRLYPKM